MMDLWNDATGTFHPASAPDYLPLPQLRELQWTRLRTVVKRAYDHVALFRQRMEKRGLKPEDFHGLEEIARLPFYEKSDLRDTYPFGLFASPMQEIVRLHASSGTTGKPIVVAYTQEDVGVWTNAMVRSFAACGIHRGDIIQNAYGYGLFTGGLGAHYGAEALGATVIPISGGNTDRQINVMKDFGVTALCCTPSYMVHLIERGREMGVDIRQLPLRVGFLGPSPGVKGCASTSKRWGGSRPSTFTGFRKSPDPEWPSNVRTIADFTSLKTTSIRRLSTRKRASRCPKGPREN